MQLGLRCGAREVGLDRERVAQADTAQVAGVLVDAGDLFELAAVAAPQDHLVAGGKGLGERGAPGARAEHGDAAAAHSPHTSLACT